MRAFILSALSQLHTAADLASPDEIILARARLLDLLASIDAADAVALAVA